MLTLLLIFAFLLYVLLINYKALKEFLTTRKRAVELLKTIPGPPTVPLLGSAHLFKWDNEDFTYQLDGWFREYVATAVPWTGMLKIWLGPVPIVILTTSDAMKPVLESSTLITKSKQYGSLQMWLGEGLLISKGKKWQTRRKMLTPTFHFNILQGFHEVFCRNAQILVDVIDQKLTKNQSIDLFPLIKRCTLDVISENKDYVEGVTRISQLAWDHERFPWLWPAPIWYATGQGFEFHRLVRESNDFTRRVIKQRRETLEAQGLLEQMKTMSPEEMKKHKFSFLDLLLGMQVAQNLSDEDIREEVDTFMFEGHDTTSSAIGYALWWLGQELDVQQRCHDEIDSIFGDSDRAITSDDLKQLPYLEMCLKESLRLTPPVPLMARVLDHDVEINGNTLPIGLTVIITPMAAGRDPRQWDHPDVYDPDNFLPEVIAKRDAYAFVPFSAGPRNCIGQKFAMAEDKIVVATLLRKFRFLTSKPFPNNRFIPEIILKPSCGFEFIIQRRR
ncbi:unnamed protein product, partial [Mesorhabditis spiculigera]